jgi:hypothetical protein
MVRTSASCGRHLLFDLFQHALAHVPSETSHVEDSCRFPHTTLQIRDGNTRAFRSDLGMAHAFPIDCGL